jgi:protein-histidine pros-kinase
VKLRTKFNLVMIGTFVAGLGIASVVFHRIAVEEARRGTFNEALMIMRNASAVRGYTSTELTPLLSDQMATRFLPHTVPSFAAQTVFRGLRGDYPDYAYKEAALNPTNPSDRATDWEADIINSFKRDETLTELVGQRDSVTGPVLTFAKPFRITDPACLTCHSTPANAPRTMVDLYGPSNGFGWALNDVIGAQIVSVPLQVAISRANDSLKTFLISLSGVFLLMLIALNIMLHLLIVRPVRRISALAKSVSEGEENVPEYQPPGHDEISSLARSFNLMRRSLDNAMRMLGTP